MLNSVLEKVKYDSGILELCGMSSARFVPTSLKCEFKTFAISSLFVKFWLLCLISNISVVFDFLFVSLLIVFHTFFGLFSQSFKVLVN